VFAAFVTGAIVMGFEMLARAISPLLRRASTPGPRDLDGARRALCRIFSRGLACDHTRHRGSWGDVASAPPICWSCRHCRAVLQFLVSAIDDIRSGSSRGARDRVLSVTFLGMYSPFAIRLLLHSRQSSGSFGNGLRRVDRRQHRRHVGTTFFLIP